MMKGEKGKRLRSMPRTVTLKRARGTSQRRSQTSRSPLAFISCATFWNRTTPPLSFGRGITGNSGNSGIARRMPAPALVMPKSSPQRAVAGRQSLDRQVRTGDGRYRSHTPLAISRKATGGSEPFIRRLVTCVPTYDSPTLMSILISSNPLRIDGEGKFLSSALLSATDSPPRYRREAARSFSCSPPGRVP